MADNNATDYCEKKLEKSISSIGAKIADANDISEEISCLSEESEKKLQDAQEELSDMYIDFGESYRPDDEAPEEPHPQKKA